MQPPISSFFPVSKADKYTFSSAAEADATYLVIAYFAVTESASLGIFPLMSALEMTQREGSASLSRFFEHGFQHFTDEQYHANLWCRCLLDFTEHYPEVVQRVRLPRQLLGVMLRSIGKPHSVINFTLDCLAFETAMEAFYPVAATRLNYPPIVPIFQTITADETNHTVKGETYLKERLAQLPKWQRTRLAIRFWRNIAGVIITLTPLISALNRQQPATWHDFLTNLRQQLKLRQI